MSIRVWNKKTCTVLQRYSRFRDIIRLKKKKKIIKMSKQT